MEVGKDLSVEGQNPQEKLKSNLVRVTEALQGFVPAGISREEWDLSMKLLWSGRESLITNSLKAMGNLDKAPADLRVAFLTLVDEVGQVACAKGNFFGTKEYKPKEDEVDFSDPKALLESRLGKDVRTYPFEDRRISGALVTLDLLKHSDYVPNEFEKGLVAEFVGESIETDTSILAYSDKNNNDFNPGLHTKRMMNFARAGLEILTR